MNLSSSPFLCSLQHTIYTLVFPEEPRVLKDTNRIGYVFSIVLRDSSCKLVTFFQEFSFKNLIFLKIFSSFRKFPFFSRMLLLIGVYF